MNLEPSRILVVDDNPAIHADFRKIFCPEPVTSAELAEAEVELFGVRLTQAQGTHYQVDSARQGQEALEMVRKANEDGRPYAVAFVDVRMPPGWDGVETSLRLWEVSPELHVVICTAYSDYDLDEMTARFKHSDRFVILKKPFDAVEARQLANAFTRKWKLHMEENRRREQMTETVSLRTAELVKSEERYRMLFDAIPLPAWVCERNTCRILAANRAAVQTYGYSVDEFLAKTARDIRSSGDLPSASGVDMSQQAAWQDRHRRKDGTELEVQVSSFPVHLQGWSAEFVLAADITESKRVVRELDIQRELLQTLLNNVPERIYFKDLQSRFVHVSASKVRKTLDRVPRLKARYEQLYAGRDSGGGGLVLGEELLVGITDFDLVGEEHARAAFEDEQKIIRTGQPVIGKLEKETHFDGSVSWSVSSKLPWRDKEGGSMGTFGISLDVTALKQAEAEAKLMEVQLRQSQKLEAIGQLAAGIAHEINTPTQYVGDNTRFLKDSFESIVRVLDSHKKFVRAAQESQVTPELTVQAQQILNEADLDYLFEQVPAAIKETLEGVERVTKIVRAMKEFSHPGSKEKAPADLNKAIETTVTVARNEWKYVADLELELDPAMPPVPCFVGEFNQAILNLVVNAAHAIGDVVKTKPGTKGKITIRTRRDGDHVEVRVSDTGTGIPEAARSHIFEPFFTTKDVGKGTGQGLSIIYGCIVKKHNGTVSFETESGKGTTFILRLPIISRGGESANAVLPEAEPMRKAA